jgi:hypothetical protein
MSSLFSWGAEMPRRSGVHYGRFFGQIAVSRARRRSGDRSTTIR